MSSSIIPTEPPVAARTRGVRPRVSAAWRLLGSASRRIVAHSTCPRSAHRCIGAIPASPGAVTLPEHLTRSVLAQGKAWARSLSWWAWPVNAASIAALHSDDETAESHGCATALLVAAEASAEAVTAISARVQIRSLDWGGASPLCRIPPISRESRLNVRLQRLLLVGAAVQHGVHDGGRGAVDHGRDAAAGQRRHAHLASQGVCSDCSPSADRMTRVATLCRLHALLRLL